MIRLGASARVPARIGLLGNPSDGFGGRVIAATVDDFAATVTIQPSTEWHVRDGDGTTTSAPSVARLGTLIGSQLRDGAELLAAAVVRLSEHPSWPDSAPPSGLRFASEIPRECGLSGSSAIIVAAIRALASMYELPFSHGEVAQLAWEAETDVLGFTAGPQDRVVQAHGGVLDMDFSDGWDPDAWQRLTPDRLPPLVLAWFPEPGTSSDVVHRDVRSRYDEGDREVIDAMGAFADLARQARLSLDRGTAAITWPGLLDRSWLLRTQFWNLSDTDHRLVDLAQHFAIGASLAGSGGAVVGVPREIGGIARFIEAVTAEGGRAIRPMIGPPVGADAFSQAAASHATFAAPAVELPESPRATSRPKLHRARVGAVILAAGFGTRLAPITDHMPKPLIEVGDKPVASHLVGLLDEVDATMPIVVVVNAKHADAWSEWVAKIGRPIQVVSNGVTSADMRLGAVADMAFALSALRPCEHVIVLAGDNLILEPLEPHLRAAEGTEAPIVLCRDLGAEVPPGRHGEVTVDTLGRVVRFREKPSDPQSPLAATCTYVLPGPGIDALLDRYLTSGDADSPGSFIGWLSRERTVFARTLQGEYFDIGNHTTLREARAALGG